MTLERPIGRLEERKRNRGDHLHRGDTQMVDQQRLVGKILTWVTFGGLVFWALWHYLT